MTPVYDEEDDLDELEETQSAQSSSRMTARQVALATGLGVEHVQLRACGDHLRLPLCSALSYVHHSSC